MPDRLNSQPERTGSVRTNEPKRNPGTAVLAYSSTGLRSICPKTKRTSEARAHLKPESAPLHSAATGGGRAAAVGVMGPSRQPSQREGILTSHIPSGTQELCRLLASKMHSAPSTIHSIIKLASALPLRRIGHALLLRCLKKPFRPRSATAVHCGCQAVYVQLELPLHRYRVSIKYSV